MGRGSADGYALQLGISRWELQTFGKYLGGGATKGPSRRPATVAAAL
jgi:hypothetical protein